MYIFLIDSPFSSAARGALRPFQEPARHLFEKGSFFYLVLLSFTGFYLVLLGFTGFYWVLLGFTGFYLVVL